VAKTPELQRVMNFRETFLTPPDVEGFEPVRLSPGGNNVHPGYLAALDKLDNGAGQVWRSWKKLKWIEVMDLARSVAEVKKPQGPVAPSTLADRTPEAAEAMVAVEQDAAVLQGWLLTEDRPEILETLKARLMGMGFDSDDSDPGLAEDLTLTETV